MEARVSSLHGDRVLDKNFKDFRARLLYFCGAIESKMGLDIIALDLRGLSSVLDAFIICHGTSTRHVRAINDAVEEILLERGEKPLFVEGLDEGNWVLVDCGDVGIHIFLEKTRDYYRLEELWSHAPVVDIGSPGSASGKQRTQESK